MSKIGILLTNTGTPAAPTQKAVRHYLREFLSDKRVISLPKFLWLPLLYGIILPLRPRQSVKLYQKIWRQDGSPMRVIMQKLALQLQKNLTQKNTDMIVEIGMNYGHPSLKEGLNHLYQKKVEKIIVLPLFPQYSNVTTASSFDRLTAALKKWPALPEFCLVRDYKDHEDYIHALALSMENTWEKKGKPQHLLISFHGIPERLIREGDPYAISCEQTAKKLAHQLNLSSHQWTLCYQSRFGYKKWLKPSTHDLLKALPQQGIKKIHVICPGFAVDCLETLEEIEIRGQETFLNAGGESLHYISALNDDHAQIEMLAKIVLARV